MLKNSNETWLALGLILCAVFGARLPFLLGGISGGDAAYHARAAVTVLDGGLLYRDVPYTYPPLYAYTEALSIGLFGNTPIGWKAVPQIYDLGVVILIYLIASRSFGKKTGLLAASLYGFSPLPFLATSSFACFDSTASFWMLAGILLLLKGNRIPSAVALGVGAAYKYFPLLLLWPATNYIFEKREKVSYLLAAAVTLLMFQVPFLFYAFHDWLNDVILFHLNRPSMGATIYNLLTLRPRLYEMPQNPLVLLSPFALLLAYLLITIRSDKSDFGLFRNMAFVMVTGVIFNKVVLFYALWFIPLIHLILGVQRKRNVILTFILLFVLQATILLAWFFSEVLLSEQNGLVMGYLYLCSSSAVAIWILRLRSNPLRGSLEKES